MSNTKLGNPENETHTSPSENKSLVSSGKSSLQIPTDSIRCPIPTRTSPSPSPMVARLEKLPTRTHSSPNLNYLLDTHPPLDTEKIPKISYADDEEILAVSEIQRIMKSKTEISFNPKSVSMGDLSLLLDQPNFQLNMTPSLGKMSESSLHDVTERGGFQRQSSFTSLSSLPYARPSTSLQPNPPEDETSTEDEQLQLDSDDDVFPNGDRHGTDFSYLRMSHQVSHDDLHSINLNSMDSFRRIGGSPTESNEPLSRVISPPIRAPNPIAHSLFQAQAGELWMRTEEEQVSSRQRHSEVEFGLLSFSPPTSLLRLSNTPLPNPVGSPGTCGANVSDLNLESIRKQYYGVGESF